MFLARFDIWLFVAETEKLHFQRSSGSVQTLFFSPNWIARCSHVKKQRLGIFNLPLKIDPNMEFWPAVIDITVGDKWFL